MVHDPPLLVAAIVRRGSDVLLVHQYGPDGPDTTWALPGGRCETGELMLDALRRELAEETGLHLDRVLGLAYVAQLDNPTPHRRDPHEIPGPGSTATVIAFEVHVTSDTTNVADPDGFVSRVEGCPRRGPPSYSGNILSPSPACLLRRGSASRPKRRPASGSCADSPTGPTWFLYSSISPRLV